jgi:Ran GTPase-activating protein (RanGAP) involved in mRNA processing and transport
MYSSNTICSLKDFREEPLREFRPHPVRKVSYDISRKLGLNNFSTNLIKYILDYFPLNDYIEISKICRNLKRVLYSMNMFKEYLNLIKKIKTYPKNIVEALFKDNAIFLTSRIHFESFLKDEEKKKIIQNYLHFFLRGKKLLFLNDSLRIGDSGIFYLSYYLEFFDCKVNSLNLNYNVISEESSIFLSEAIGKNNTLKYIHINGVNFSPEVCKTIGDGLSKNTSIEKLEMCYNNSLRAEGISILFSSLKINKTLQSLFFNDNLLKKEGSKILSGYIKDNPNLKELYIEKNDIGDEGLFYIANSLKNNKSLEILNLSDNHITAVGLKSLSSALEQISQNYEKNFEIKNDFNMINIFIEDKREKTYTSNNNSKSLCNLKKLFLRNNSFNNNEGSKIIGEIVKNNKTLNFLDISNNGLSENLIRPLSDAIKINHTLENLILETNSLGAQGCAIISEGLKFNKGIRFLNLRNNSLGFEGAKHISDMLMVNKTLNNLNLQANLLDEHSITLIADKIGYNTELKIINLAFNQLPNANDVLTNLTLAKDVIIY